MSSWADELLAILRELDIELEEINCRAQVRIEWKKKVLENLEKVKDKFEIQRKLVEEYYGAALEDYIERGGPSKTEGKIHEGD